MNRIITLFLLISLHLSPLMNESMTISAKKNSKKEVTKEAISKRKSRNKKQIRETNRKIQTNTAEVSRRLHELNLITAEINECKSSINEINKAVNALDSQIKNITDSIEILDDRLQTMSGKYAAALRKMQTRSSVGTSEIAFIFSAKSFAEAYRRSQALKQFSHWRKKKADELDKIKSDLNSRKAELENKKAERQQLLGSLNSHLGDLSSKKQKSDILVDQLRKEGSQLKAILARQQQEANDLDRELNRLIALEQERMRKAEEERKQAEEQRAREQAEKERKLKEQEEQRRQKEQAETDKNKQQSTQPGKPAKQKQSPESKIKDSSESKTNNGNGKPVVKKPVNDDKGKNNAPEKKPVEKHESGKQNSKTDTHDNMKFTEFSKAKGSLPYPVKGKVVKKFGRQQHPELKHVVTDNPGIDIETKPGTEVKNVFEGYVSDIFRLPGYNTIVMIRHGSYLTIYANLGSISVKKGDKLKKGQTIGKVYADPDDNSRSILHFEVRNERSKEDPETWLRK